MKTYTPQQTAEFKRKRNEITKAEKFRKQHPEMVHVSVKTITHTPEGIKREIPLRSAGKTFFGSIRNLFTGARRNNRVSV